MTTSLENSRADLLHSALDLLWRQWTLLGVPGHAPETAPSLPRIIDPEALLLFTTELGRYDARLLDEVTNWLRQYARLINVQRLKTLHHTHHLGDTAALSALAATLLQNARMAKWKTLASLAEPPPEPRALFLREDGGDLPAHGPIDPVYAAYGLTRGLQPVRSDARPPQIDHPGVLLIKLRALFGVSARAEIIAALLTEESAHPAALAHRIGYLPRTVQDNLNEMALSGHVAGARVPGLREKHFALRPHDWQFLITWEARSFPSWVEWAVRFALVQDALGLLAGRFGPPDLTVALRFREIYERHYPALSRAGLAGRFTRTAHASGIEFAGAFLSELSESWQA